VAKKVIPFTQKRTAVSCSRQTLAQLAAKQKELERRLATLEKYHNEMLTTLSHNIDDLSTKVKTRITTLRDETVEGVLRSLMPQMTAIYDASQHGENKF
jgi:uncharacterized protein YhaN